jgi:hypothetical protein
MGKTISIDLQAGTASFIEKMNKSADTIEHLGQKADGASGFLSKFKEGLELGEGIEVARRGFEIIGEGIAKIREAFEQAFQINRDALKLGVTAEEMSRFQHAANATHTDVATLTMGMDHLDVVLGKIVSGDASADKAAAAFAKLGLNAKDLAGSDPAEVFQRVSSAIAGMNNQFERAAIVRELFGRGGRELIPIMSHLNGLMAESDLIGFTRTA